VTSGRGLPSKLQYRRAAETRRALRGFLRETEQITRLHGLTPERYELLLMIRVSADEGACATVTSICGGLHLRQSAATQLVDRAVRLGLIQRERSGEDRRVYHLALTAEGERRLAGAVTTLRTERERFARTLAALTGKDQV
jgi:DNA-binding MarR family transcriptional regulator